MAVALSGIATLLVVVLAGPLAWALAWLVRRHRSPKVTSAASASQSRSRGAADDSKSTSADMGTASHPAAKREEVSGIEYLLGQLGYAIGIGNLWRFPFLVGRWGGGAFVVAYLTCMTLVAIPAYLMEVFLGQYTRKSTVECFRMIHPRWVGLAYGQTFMLFCGITYYNTLLGYAVVYIAGSLFDPLPWVGNSASYWNDTVLNNYAGQYEGRGLGPVQWRLGLALLFVYAVVFLSIAFGKHVLAKVTWVTVVLPIVLLAVVLVRAVTLEGAADGLEFYLGKFDVDVLGDLNMWAAACGQILFSLSPGFGTAITLTSFTKPKENVFKSCMITTLSNSAFSLVGGVAIFSLVGNIAYRINAAGGVLDPATGQMVATSVAEQARAGTGLAFIVIADGMQWFGSGANIMSVLFFTVLFLLGLDSTFAWVETFVCLVEEFMYEQLHFKPARWALVGGVSAMFFSLGLLYCTRIGNELLDVTDHYVSGYFIMFAVFLEAIMFALDFGWRRLVVHVKYSTLGNPNTPAGKDLSVFWRVTMCAIVPATCITMFSYVLVHDAQAAYQGYPAWLQAVGWTLLGVCLAVTPIGGAWSWRRCGAGTLAPLKEEERRLGEAVEPTSSQVRV